MKKAVILAGGLGTRLKPLTEVIPKPLLPIGEKSVLEIQVQRLSKYGFEEIIVATNYKANYIESFMGDGERFGVNIRFSREEEPLGTCGPLSMLRSELSEPFILMNGDILTTLNYDELYRYGLARGCNLTVVTKELRTPFNFGSVKVKDDLLWDVEEKPDLVIEILAGIYYMQPSILEYIPDKTYFGIDHLIKKLLALGVPIGRYLTHAYWLDIGRLDDYQEAQLAYEKHFKSVE